MKNQDEPRLLDVDLESVSPWRAMPWTARGSEARRMARWRGGGLAIALLSESEPTSVPLVLSVGECVVRGVPTAARVSVASRSPLSGVLSEGLVGSDFGRRMASVADALRIRGRAPRPDSVLVIEPDGLAHLVSAPETRGLSSSAAHAALEARLGPSATLSIGPMGEAGSPIASLAACSSSSAGGGPAHFAGRGGLGAVLAARGLKAIAVRATAAPGVRDSELTRALTSSPRLQARARGGTLELAHSLAARGDLGDRGSDAGDARALAKHAEDARDHQHGCLGCPTPCGWVFKRSNAPGQAARFGASHALSLQLGFSDFDAALGLLARCDELGIDAKEVGAGLALLAETEAGARGNPQWFARALDEAADNRGPAALLVHGVHALALARGATATTVRRSAVRPDKNLASLLGQCVSARGTDPMRAFPFLAAESAGLDALRELCAPLDLPKGSEDPFSTTGKGRLVGWHEDLVLALDLTGFCAFSASALLSDRLASLDALAVWLAPQALKEEEHFARAPGRALLAAGKDLARAQRELNASWGWRESDDLPAWAFDRLSPPGMEPEYRAYRKNPAGFESATSNVGSEGSAPLAAADRARGIVRIAAFGSLGELLGTSCAVELELPAPALEVLRAAAAQFPKARIALLRGDTPLPALYRSGVRVDPRDSVKAGETLDLLLVVGGG